MNTIFSSEALGIVLSRQDDGTLSWSGKYNGIIIKTAVLTDQDRCILLLDPDYNKLPVFQNLLCINNMGKIMWVAQLPASPDVFLGISLTNSGIWATTWSGFKILIDKNSGAELKKIFVK